MKSYLTITCKKELLLQIPDDAKKNIKGSEMPNKDIINIQRQNFKEYCTFATYFISSVVGKQRFDNLCWRSPFSSFVSKSDEAFALLIFENNYEHWTAMAGEGVWSSSIIRPVYTTGGNVLQTPKPTKLDQVCPICKKASSQKEQKATRSVCPTLEATSARCQGWSVLGI